MAITINSTNIKIFPAANRNAVSEANNQVKTYNPESKLTLEENIVNILNSINTIDSYVVNSSYGGTAILNFVIHGYLFSLSNISTLFANYKAWTSLYACIYVKSNTFVDSDNISYNFKNLVTVDGNASNLDVYDSGISSSKFVGIQFDNTDSFQAISNCEKYTLLLLTKTAQSEWSTATIPAQSRLKFNTAVIKDLANVPISDTFTTNTLNVQDGLSAKRASIQNTLNVSGNTTLEGNVDINGSTLRVPSGNVSAGGTISATTISASNEITSPTLRGTNVNATNVNATTITGTDVNASTITSTGKSTLNSLDVTTNMKANSITSDTSLTGDSLSVNTANVTDSINAKSATITTSISTNSIGTNTLTATGKITANSIESEGAMTAINIEATNGVFDSSITSPSATLTTINSTNIHTNNLYSDTGLINIHDNISMPDYTITAKTYIGDLSGNATTATTATDYNTSSGTIKGGFDALSSIIDLIEKGIQQVGYSKVSDGLVVGDYLGGKVLKSDNIFTLNNDNLQTVTSNVKFTGNSVNINLLETNGIQPSGNGTPVNLSHIGLYNKYYENVWSKYIHATRLVNATYSTDFDTYAIDIPIRRGTMALTEDLEPYFNSTVLYSYNSDIRLYDIEMDGYDGHFIGDSTSPNNTTKLTDKTSDFTDDRISMALCYVSAWHVNDKYNILEASKLGFRYIIGVFSSYIMNTATNGGRSLPFYIGNEANVTPSSSSVTKISNDGMSRYTSIRIVVDDNDYSKDAGMWLLVLGIE